MKAFEVTWDFDAETALARIYLIAKDPNSIWPAQHKVDRKLEQQPQLVGFELSEGLWQIIQPPIKVFYEIDDVKRIVTVTHIELMGK